MTTRQNRSLVKVYNEIVDREEGRVGLGEAHEIATIEIRKILDERVRNSIKGEQG